MKKIIYNKFDKKAIPSLPQVIFPGRIFVVINAAELRRLLTICLVPTLGVDTETRPSFKKGQNHKVSLLQVSTIDTCFLFSAQRHGITPDIKRLLENTKVPMVGLSWHDDLLSLHRRTPFEPGLFIDLQNLVGKIGIEDLSLQKLYANLFHQKISKRQRLTNWDADVLDSKQKAYAATDAWACIKIYEELMRLMSTGDYELVTVDEGSEKGSEVGHKINAAS